MRTIMAQERSIDKLSQRVMPKITQFLEGVPELLEIGGTKFLVPFDNTISTSGSITVSSIESLGSAAIFKPSALAAVGLFALPMTRRRGAARWGLPLPRSGRQEAFLTWAA
jgi:hypothetical protein